jgi:DNA-binding NtrC family response regulator
LTVPPLRERTADLEPLVEAFVARICRELERPPVRVSVDAMRCLRAYPWPGNVRELKNAIERAVVLSDADVLTTEALPATVLKGAAAPGPVSGAPGLASNAIPPPRAPPANPHGAAHRGEPVGAGDEVRALERARIVEALERSGGNQTEAATLLGISRRTLVSRLTVYGLPRPRKRGPLAE